jgi:hypothetical protein
MAKIYQQLIDQAVVNGVITPEQYLQIPWNERDSMQYLFSFDGRQALAHGDITFEQYLQILVYYRKMNQGVDSSVITLERFLQIPWYERSSMSCLFSPDGRQAVADGIITLEQYLQIPWDERNGMEYLFLPDGRQAFADGIITLEQYLQVPVFHPRMDPTVDERNSILCSFSPNERQAIANGIITFEQCICLYLQLPPLERNSMQSLLLQVRWTNRISMQYLFSPDGRQAFADGIITLEQYLQIPSDKRDSMQYLFSPDGRQAFADGIITLEQYLQIPSYDRDSMQYLFSPNGRQTFADGIITLEQYLQIPWYDRQNVIIALQDHDTRQRIINGQIAIENIIGLDPAYGVATHPINGIQNTHTASVHQSVSESATRLANLYELRINCAGLESTIGKAQAYINGLLDDSKKNRAAKRGFLRIVAPDYTFTDKSSQVTIRQLLALTFLAIHDDEKRVGSLEDAEMQFVEALYEIQRGYNLSESGIDQGGQDRYICSAGTFNKLIEKLHGIHPDCRVLYITEETASLKLPIVVREEGMRYLTTFSTTNAAEALPTFTRLMAQVKQDGVEVIWDHIKNNIATRMFDEFGSLYRNITDPHFTALIEAGKDVVLEDLNTFQEHVQSGSHLSQHRYDGSEAQKEDVIDPHLICMSLILLIQLKMLENKAEILRVRNHILAYCKAANIVQLLLSLHQDYFIEKKIDYKTYKEKSLDIINEERPELDKHRGYKKILGNLLILICTLGTGQLINKACTGNFLFFKKTDSSKHIDKVSHTIEKMEVTLKSS